MTMEATVQELRALVQLAELDALMPDLSPKTYRSRCEASRQRVSAGLLDRYQTLLQTGHFPAIVAIERGSCSGCHLRLPTMVEHQARRSGAVHTCPLCRRLLYAPERVAEPSRRSVSKKRAGTPDHP